MNALRELETRVWSDKYRTGIITIVPVRTATVNFEKSRILKKTGNFQTKHFVYYKLEKVNFLTYNENNNNNSIVNNSCQSQTFFN